MPVLTQLKLNIGTEQNPNMVLHDLHDIRISSTDVNTVTRLLGCDAGVNSIAPLTLANAASLLGGLPKVTNVPTNLDTAVEQGVYILNGSYSYTHNYGVLIVFEGRNNYGIQIVWDQGDKKLYSRGRVGQQDFSDINWV